MAALMLLTMTTAEAKKVVTPKMYMYGFAASFNDTIVHFTNVQEIDSVWIDSKNKFLLGRENYSYQLRDYLNSQEMPYRTCIVVYHQDRQKLEKKYLKMKRLYTKGKDGKEHYEVRYIEDNQFHFQSVDMSDPEVVSAEEPQPKKDKKASKKKSQKTPKKK